MVESRIVIPVVVGSSPIGHPIISQRIPPVQKWMPPALDAGTAAGAAFVANISAAVVQIRANARGALLGHDPEHLHQLRVGIRRMRATLRAFRRLVRRRIAQRFERELRTLLRALAAARDWDVFLQSQSDPVLRRVARRRRAAAHRSAQRVLSQDRFGSVLRRALAWARSEPWRASADSREPLGAFGARSLRRLYRAMGRRAADMDWSDPAQRHRARIRLKWLRYGYDCFAAGFAPRALKAFLHRLRSLQHILGELNDIRVQRGLLRGLASEAGLGRTVASARARLTARERSLTLEAETVWSKIAAHPPRWRRQAARAPI